MAYQVLTNLINNIMAAQAEEAKVEESKPFATVVFIRHGQSEWNASNQFTGWVDVGLTDLGRKEAAEGAAEIKKAGLVFDCMFTSFLKRAIITGNMVLEATDQLYIPVKKSWRLNERMYGGLQGLNKVETVEKHGKEQVISMIINRKTLCIHIFRNFPKFPCVFRVSLCLEMDINIKNVDSSHFITYFRC